MANNEKIDLSRRTFTRLAMTFGLTAAICPLSALMLPESALAAPVRPLRLFNPHTKEQYDIELFANGEWNQMGILACDWMMRDWRENQTVQCDRKLYAALYVIQHHFGVREPISINSGYRSPKTNSMLRSRSIKKRGRATEETPAVNSKHIEAKAMDYAFANVKPRAVFDYVKSLKMGGVGNYSTFTHMDTGNIRTWGE